MSVTHTLEERKALKRAKRDHKEWRENNPAGFKNSRNQFIAMIIDKRKAVKRKNYNLVFSFELCAN